VIEQQLRSGRRGRLLRPFCGRAQVRPRGYSTLLQRVLTDFGAEHSFAQAETRVQEHYGIAVSPSSARRISLAHGTQIASLAPAPPPPTPVETLVTEMDGSFIPLVEYDPPPVAALAAVPVDRRKCKRLLWKEVRLCAARALGSRQTLYDATLGSVLEAALAWEAVAQRAGLGPKTRVHGVGDGAEYLCASFGERFGAQGRYLLDFWHVSDYLAAAAAGCAGAAASGAWLDRQQARLKTNDAHSVLSELAGHIEPEVPRARARRADEPSPTPVRDAHRYLSARREQLDYAGALAAGLPIGSGLIEGGHRHVVQARLKRSGAWWLEGNARSMLALRVARANGDWPRYWNQLPSLNN
jgi:hypothetical protein